MYKRHGRDSQVSSNHFKDIQSLFEPKLIKKTSVDNPWLRHSSHPQEKEGGPKKKKKKPPFSPHPCCPTPPTPAELYPLPFSESDCPGRFPFSESDRPGRFRRSIKTRNYPIGRTHTHTYVVIIYKTSGCPWPKATVKYPPFFKSYLFSLNREHASPGQDGYP
jgi:hypothetical protein